MINSMKKHIRSLRYLTSVISLALMLVSLGALAVRGLNLGLDFTGGMVTEVALAPTVTNHQLLDAVQPILGESATVTKAGEEGRWVIRYSLPEEQTSLPDLASGLASVSSQVSVISNSVVGAQVGQDLLEQGGMAMLACLLAILAYLCLRFEWRLAGGSLVALLHDVLLVLGFFAITQMEFNLTVFAAILAILGYSLNDSIIIADRIRELLIAKQDETTEQINDQAVIRTFSRTMITSGTTLITIAALWLMGGSALQGFSTAMFIGVLSGTWSSISIGTVLPEWWQLKPVHYLPSEIDTAP